MLTSKETCERKKSFPDVFAAVWWGEKRGLAAYQCNVCSKWHLTSRARWQSIDGMRQDERRIRQ